MNIFNISTSRVQTTGSNAAVIFLFCNLIGLRTSAARGSGSASSDLEVGSGVEQGDNLINQWHLGVGGGAVILPYCRSNYYHSLCPATMSGVLKVLRLGLLPGGLRELPACLDSHGGHIPRRN